jgi:hypothetical protein
MKRSAFWGLALVLLFGAAPASALTFTSWVSDFSDDGYVDEDSPLSFEHHFTPGYTGPLVVTKVTLKVAVIDDAWDRAGEWFAASIGDDVFDSGWATFNIFGEDVTSLADIHSWGDTLRVTIASLGGDFQVFKSLATFTYRIGERVEHPPGTAVPEPGAALAFSVGGLLIAAATRRRR